MRIEYQDALGNISTSSGYTASVRKDGLKLYAIEDGFRAEYTFVDEEIVIPLDVQLQPDGLHCSVPVAEIQELGENRLLTLTLLPAGGAGVYRGKCAAAGVRHLQRDVRPAGGDR